jgi:peptidyl-tRNA hydrolase
MNVTASRSESRLPGVRAAGGEPVGAVHLDTHVSTGHTGLEGLEELSGDRNVPRIWVGVGEEKKEELSDFQVCNF